MTTSNKTLDERHDKLVAALAKPGEDICSIMDSEKADLMHGAVGVCTEAGELLDAVKKAVFYNKPLDIENVIEELGDLEFYIRMVRRNVGVSREETLAANILKLNKRYASGTYSDDQARRRADKETSHG